MHPSQLCRFAQLRPAIRREWERLLRLEPAASALGDPDVLVHLMDRTIDELLAGLREPSENWLRHRSLAYQPLRVACNCTLNPLLNYFATGELAVRSAAARSHRAEIADILNLFHALAQQEINALCSVCQRRGNPDCLVGFRGESGPVSPSRSLSAASRAKPSATGPSPAGTPG